MPKNATQNRAVNTPKTVVVQEHRIACDGGGGANGHPKVFMDMGQASDVTCKYCGLKFIYKA